MMFHARLSCSDSHAWIHCPRKIGLAEGLPEVSWGNAAPAGTVVHEEFERISNGGDPELSIEARERLEELDYSAEWAIAQLVSALNAKSRYFEDHDIEHALYEVKVSPGAMIGRDDLWGTADIVAIDKSRTRLHVLDLKTGRWAVNPVGNPQLGLYAAGALHAMGEQADQVEEVHIGIIQPPISRDVITWRCTKTELIDFMHGSVKTAAELSDDPEFPPHPGEWCRFCRAKDVCPAR